MKLSYFLKLVLGTIILTVLHVLSEIFFTGGTTLNITYVSWALISNFLIIALLGFYVRQSTLKGVKLTFSIFLIYYIIRHFNILIEAYIFNVTDREETIREMLQGLFIASLFSPVFVYLFNKWAGKIKVLQFKKRSIFSWVWRVISGVFLYLIFYITAGIILQTAYPGLMDFYKDKLPSMDVMFLTQFPRGLLFVAVAVLILRTAQTKQMQSAVLIGLVFSILGGIAPLIIPNELMPGNIRLVHGFEVGISNFLYGFALGFLLRQKTLYENPSSANTL